MKTNQIVKGSVALVAVALLGAPLSARAQAADEEWVEVTGEAAVVGGNEVAAKEKALDQAQRNAVEMVAGTIVTGISEMKQYTSVRDEITSQGSGYVKRYEPKGSTCEGGVCKVTIRALVAKRALSEKLAEIGLLAAKRGYPRVILLIAEKRVDSSQPTAWWTAGANAGPRSQIAENELIKYLNKVVDKSNAPACADKPVHNSPGKVTPQWPSRPECWDDLPPGQRFRFVDYTSLASHPVVQKAGSELTDVQARAIASLTDAEMAIVGTATSEVSGQYETNTDGLWFVWSDINLRVIDVASGRVVTTAHARVSTYHVAKATAGNVGLLQVARAVVPELQKGIAESWQGDEYGARWIRLEVAGVGNYGDLQQFKGLLTSAVTGVKSVQERKMEAGSALLELQCTSTSQQLATELSSRPLGKFSVTVTKVLPDVVGLTLGK